MNSPQLHANHHYTVADYVAWNDGQRYELLHGSIHAMSPAPNIRHQGISGNLSWHLRSLLNPKSPCQLFYAPIDVYLSDDTVVQPDIIVVCTPQKLQKKGCVGAPDLVVEILSPATLKTDWTEKYRLYEEAGVREYWIVNPDDNLLHVFRLSDGKFFLAGTYTPENSVEIDIFEDIVIDLKPIFEPQFSDSEDGG